jgi:hypothetical protein
VIECPIQVSCVDNIDPELKGMADKFPSPFGAYIGLKRAQGKGSVNQGGDFKAGISELYSVQWILLI